MRLKPRVWHEVVKSDEWVLKPGDDVPWLDGWPGDSARPVATFTVQLERPIESKTRLSVRSCVR
jgi:hypothetical protein